jgi:hypothetical protein
MKTIMYALVVALFVTSLATPGFATTYASGPSASGTYRIVLEDNLSKTVEFNAATDERGVTTGNMTYRDEAGTVNWDPDGDKERSEDPPTEFYMTANLDSLAIDHNRAVMGGTVRDASDPNYIGRWVQLVVEDNGDGSEDKLSWCFCQPEPGGWIPADSEVPRDDGAYWHWLATDAEVRDDPGVPSENIIPGNGVGCRTFPVATYEFRDERGDGQIQVLP